MTPQEKLADAETKLHEIITTGGVTQIETEAGKVSYGPADRAKLEAYIATLRAEITRTRVRSAIAPRL